MANGQRNGSARQIRVEEILEHDDGIFDVEIINEEKYVIFNVLFDTGACGSILDKKTWECYKFHHPQPRNLTIKTVMGAKRQEYERNMLTTMAPKGYKLNYKKGLRKVHTGNLCGVRMVC